mmetsp:Transcript_2826/g.6167  ORF Transcript_2826/g.6167 Transcript_2826/m.6167 type:complete len:128 (+) Transcript_2826:70-453(+)
MSASNTRSARFATFRKVWLVPDVYPLLGALGAAAGLIVYFSYHKLFRDPSVVVSRRLRNAGFFEQFDSRPQDIGHMTGLAHVSKKWSTRMLDPTDYNHIHAYNTPEVIEREHRRVMIAEEHEKLPPV